MRIDVAAGKLPPTLELTGRPSRPPGSVELWQPHLAENLIIGFEHFDERAHPFFGIRSQLLRHAKVTGQRIFAVTSVQPRNGKTLVAVNLAAVLSRISPTVLLELDLRRPSIGARLGLPQDRAGVDDFLEGRASWRNTGTRIRDFDLTVHRVRELRDNAEQLLASPGLGELLAEIRASADNPICIVDSPPAVVGDDIMLIARAIDGVLMVVEEARTPKRALLDAINALSPTPVVGTILNRSLSSTSPGIDYDHYRPRNPQVDAPPKTGFPQRKRRRFSKKDSGETV